MFGVYARQFLFPEKVCALFYKLTISNLFLLCIYIVQILSNFSL